MIIVDNREVPSDVLSILDQLNLPHQEAQLELADFHIFGCPIGVTGINGECVVYLIERKSAGDYIQSLTSGHLNDQLVRMSRATKHSALVFIGSLSTTIRQSGVSPQAVYSSMVGTFLKHAKDGEQGNISLIMLENLEEFGKFLFYVQKKLDDKDGLIREPTLVAPPQVFDKCDMVRSLMCITNIGETKARSLLRVHGSIFLMCQKEPKDLVCEGVGLGLATTVYSHLRTMYTEAMTIE